MTSKYIKFDAAVDRFEIAARMCESKDKFSPQEQEEIQAEFDAARQNLEQRRDHIFGLAKDRAFMAREAEAKMLKAQDLFKVLCRTPIGHNGPRGILPIFVQDFDPKIKDAVSKYERQDGSQILADYLADEMEATLNKVKSNTDASMIVDEFERRIEELRNQTRK